MMASEGETRLQFQRRLADKYARLAVARDQLRSVTPDAVNFVARNSGADATMARAALRTVLEEMR